MEEGAWSQLERTGLPEKERTEEFVGSLSEDFDASKSSK